MGSLANLGKARFIQATFLARRDKHMFGIKRSVFLFTLLSVLLTTSIVFAAHTTINTNDAQVDTNWGVVPALVTDGDDFADDNYDIDQAWIGNAADNSYFYFRA